MEWYKVKRVVKWTRICVFKFKWCIILLNNQWRHKSHHGQHLIPLFCSHTCQKISLICPAVKNYVPVFTQQATGGEFGGKGRKGWKGVKFFIGGTFHLKLHLTFIYAFIPRFYSIACLSKLRSIITSLAQPYKYFHHGAVTKYSSKFWGILLLKALYVSVRIFPSCFSHNFFHLFSQSFQSVTRNLSLWLEFSVIDNFLVYYAKF